MVYAIFLIILFVLLNIVSGAFNGMMDISAGPFQNSQISHWNATFWEKYGNGQAWRNIWHNRNEESGIHAYWVIFGFKITKPVPICDGWHLMKFGWRTFDVLALVPMVMAYITLSYQYQWHPHEVLYAALIGSAVSYFSEWVGFALTLHFLVKKS